MHRPLAFLTSHFGSRPPWPIPLFPTPTDSLSGHLHSSSFSGRIQTCISPSISHSSTTLAGRHVHLPLILTRQYNFIAGPPSVPDIQQFFQGHALPYMFHKSNLSTLVHLLEHRSLFDTTHIHQPIFGVVSYPYVCKGSI